MNTTLASAPDLVADRLLAEHRRGFSLQAAFYTDPEVYRLDLDRIWRRAWLFAGHACQAPRPGDFFTVGIDTDSIVIVRDESGVLHALRNTCRHRGARI
jgi:Rieske 2Fe-2S family protein